MKWWPFSSERKENPVGSAIAGFSVGTPVWTDRRYDRFADEAYVRNAIGYRCTKLIAGGAASVPWCLYNKQNKKIETHPLLDLLNLPAPMIGGEVLFEAFYAYLLISGNGYLVGPKLDKGRPPKELWTLRPDRTKVIPGRAGLPAGFEYEANGQKVTFSADPLTGFSEVFHLKEFHPLNDWYGLGRVEPAAYGIDRHNAASAHNKALLDNGARPSGALIFQPVTSPNGPPESAPQSVIDAAIKSLKNDHGGAENAGKPMVFGGNVKWEEMGLSPKNMDFGDNKDDAARDICTSFGVPHLLVVPGDATYNNIREAKLWLWTDTILPLLRRGTRGLNIWLTPQYGDGLRLEPDLDKIDALEPLRESKRTSIITLYKEGLVTDDEARADLQYPEREKGSVHLSGKEGTILTPLIQAANSNAGAIEPLYRYLLSIGLIDPATTLEKFKAEWEVGPSQDDIMAALGQQPQPNPTDTALPDDPGTQAPQE